MNKKSFTLIEMLISITLFSIVIVFLYNSLEQSEKSNKFYSKKLNEQKNYKQIKKTFFEDIVNRKINENFSIIEDKNKNAILTFKTKNTFHNPFYEYVTYKIIDKNILYRIQSKTKLHEGFIDIVHNNVIKFKVAIKNKKFIIIYVKFKNGDDFYFNLKL